MSFVLRLLLLGAVFAVAGCPSHEPEALPEDARPAIEEGPDADSAADPVTGLLETVHRETDDLLSAGLGLEGLRGEPPIPATPAEASTSELRRLAVHTQWRSLVDLTESGGFGPNDPGLPSVPGREFHAFLSLDGRDQPFRVLVQLPDAFDPERPCLVLAPASGSRGVYGALPVAGPWALPRGCAVAYTDKGAGTDLFDLAADTGVGLDGRRAARGEAALGFEPAADPDAGLIAVPHAHSGDHPEADWGRHVLRSASFALEVLNRAAGGSTPFTAGNTRIVALGLSNGGGAVLRALEADDSGLIHGAVAVAPNITPPQARPLYDYATEAALLQPCQLADSLAIGRMPLGNPYLLAPGRARCETLAAAELLDRPDPGAARARLAEGGFGDQALALGAVNVGLDLWRTVAAVYASAYLGAGPADMPCGYRVAVIAEDGTPRTPSYEEAALWWALSAGVPGSAGVELVDTLADGADPAAAGLRCLRELWTGDGEASERLRAAVEATRASARLPDVPVLVLHGIDDGLVPVDLSSRPYVAAARERGAENLAYWEIPGAQHFDALVPLPGVAGRYRPLLPETWAAMDHLWQVLDGTAELGGDRRIEFASGD